MSNTFGKIFRITSFGESHSKGLGVVIDGCPSGIKICLKEVQEFLNERRPGQSAYVTDRKEADELICLSGLQDGVSLGTPIALVVYNKEAQKSDYHSLENVFRPSHGDFTTYSKYGVKSHSGGGRSSARETWSRVAAAGVARQVLRQFLPELQVLSYVEQIQNVFWKKEEDFSLTREKIYESPVRCPHFETSKKMEDLILKVKKEGDSVGGVIRTLILNPPVGLGEPVFDKLDALLASAMMSLPAVKGFELGKGFSASLMRGSDHNDAFVKKEGRVRTETNHSGGVQAGFSNGEAIDFRVVFKPTSTIFKKQKTVTLEGKETLLDLERTRHDPCVLPRAVPIVEAMSYLTLLDLYLRDRLYH